MSIEAVTTALQVNTTTGNGESLVLPEPQLVIREQFAREPMCGTASANKTHYRVNCFGHMFSPVIGNASAYFGLYFLYLTVGQLAQGSNEFGKFFLFSEANIPSNFGCFFSESINPRRENFRKFCRVTPLRFCPETVRKANKISLSCLLRDFLRVPPAQSFPPGCKKVANESDYRTAENPTTTGSTSQSML